MEDPSALKGPALGVLCIIYVHDDNTNFCVWFIA